MSNISKLQKLFFSSNKCVLGCGMALAVLIPLHAKSSETVLYPFTGGNDGTYPFAGLVADKKGNFYGTTLAGGPYGQYGSGTVFKLKPDGTESVLYSFTGGGDGFGPNGGLIMDTKGNLYGTTLNGGADDSGVVFKVTPKGKETVLYSFMGGSDGAYPAAGLIADTTGNFYSTTVYGGKYNNGTVFKLAPDGTETVLYSFCLKANCADGALPYGPLIADSNGNFYGTAGGYNYSGVVFKVTPKGKETVLYSFTGGSDGGHPLAGLLMDSSGNLYGVTAFGGANSEGVVFELAPDGTETVLYSFCIKKNCADGANPIASLIMDSSGNLYSTTGYGGKNNNGTVFKLAPDGTETVLHTFKGGNDGAHPSAGLIRKKGNLYGTTEYGGADNYGTVFKVSK